MRITKENIKDAKDVIAIGGTVFSVYANTYMPSAGIVKTTVAHYATGVGTMIATFLPLLALQTARVGYEALPRSVRSKMNVAANKIPPRVQPFIKNSLLLCGVVTCAFSGIQGYKITEDLVKYGVLPPEEKKSTEYVLPTAPQEAGKQIKVGNKTFSIN